MMFQQIHFGLFLLINVFIHATLGKKNILFLVADDMRPNLGAYSNDMLFKSPPMHTPNLDDLANTGVLFTQAFVQQALCSPSRTSFLTGRRPDTTRVTKIGPYWRDIGGNFTTIPQFFKDQGYKTVGGGKIFHEGPSSNDDDNEFSWSVKFHHAEDPFPGDRSVVWKSFSPDDLRDNCLQDTNEADYIIENLRELASSYKDEGVPFFLAFGVHKPHMPFYFPEQYLEFYPPDHIETPYNPNCPIDMPDIAWHIPPIINYDDCSPDAMGIPNLGDMNVTWPDWKIKELRRAYYAAISYVDYELGRVLNEVRYLGLEEDTIIVFLGDHGWQLGEHAEWAKQTNFKIANRVPLIIRVPGYISGEYDSFVELVDIFPTLVKVAGFGSLDVCPEHSDDIELCTEGTVIQIYEDSGKIDAKYAVFWQYPRGEIRDDDLPSQMGYTITINELGFGYYRYTEWVNIRFLGGLEYEPDWENPADHEELYDLILDPQENVNR